MKNIVRKTLISIAISSALTVSSSQVFADLTVGDSTADESSHTAMGVGAVSGALVAGPAGFVIGGVLGSFFGEQDAEKLESEIEATVESEPNEYNEPDDEFSDLMVASSNDLVPADDTELLDTADRIKQIITHDLNMAVYFKPGSVDFETFYSRQFSTITNLLHEMTELELNLDGYSDRQGSQDDNLQLSAQRLESVRDYFINSGIDKSRINVRAYGEKNFVSTPGELDSYVFDRRVVVSFRESTKNSHNSVAVVKKAPSL